MKDNPFTRADLGTILYLCGYAFGSNSKEPPEERWDKGAMAETIAACAHLQILFDLIQKEEDA